eukprot:Mycagemm_TRINITY_DN10280_c0_g12::TRINITY_DN10280_c0_g12_i1::g.3778::m.3778 type:complete len:173 gc:universal TRINITY_DN10280_c0_g12_i1:593-75(-)
MALNCASWLLRDAVVGAVAASTAFCGTGACFFLSSWLFREVVLTGPFLSSWLLREAVVAGAADFGAAAAADFGSADFGAAAAALIGSADLGAAAPPTAGTAGAEAWAGTESRLTRLMMHSLVSPHSERRCSSCSCLPAKMYRCSTGWRPVLLHIWSFRFLTVSEGETLASMT